MKNIKKIITAALVGVMTFSLAGCKMIQKTPEAIQKTVVGKVNNEKITLGQVDERIKSTIDQLKQQYGEDLSKSEEAANALQQQRKQALDNLIVEKVFLAKAEELKVVPSKEEIDKEVATKLQDIKKVYDTDDKYKAALTAANFTEETLKAYLADQVKIQKVIDTIFKDLKPVTDADIENYYKENKTQYTKEAGANMKHILAKVDSNASDADKKKAEEKAKSIKAEVDKEGFDTVFNKYKNGADQSVIAEDLSFVPYTQANYDKDFLAGTKNLKEGEVSNPVKSSFGYHIIQVKNVQSEAKTQPLSEVKAQIKESLESEAKNKAYSSKLEEWKKALNVETYEDKLK